MSANSDSVSTQINAVCVGIPDVSGIDSSAFLTGFSLPVFCFFLGMIISTIWSLIRRL